MSDVILNANQASSLVQTLDSTSSTRNPFEYSYPKDLENSNIPCHSVSYQVIQPNSTKSFNSANDFLIPKQGFLTKLYLKVTVHNDTAFFPSNTFFPLLITEIEALTQGRRIYHSTSESLLAYVSDQPAQAKEAMQNAMKILAHSTTRVSRNTFTGYIPIMFYSFNNIAACLHTDFLENLVVRVNVGNPASLASTASGDSGDTLSTLSNFSLQTLELVGEYRRVPAQVEQQIVEYNYKEGNLVIVNNDPVIETATATLTGALPKIDITLNSNRVVQKMYIGVDRRSESDVSNRLTNRGSFVTIKNIKFEAGGQVILPDTIDSEMMQLLNQHDIDERGYSNSNFNSSVSAGVRSTNNWYVINFGLSKNCCKRNSNGISLRELTNAKITATLADTVSGNVEHTITVVMQCAGLLSVSSASGRITQALNS